MAAESLPSPGPAIEGPGERYRRRAGRREFRLITAGVALLYSAYAAAVFAGAPEGLGSLVFAVVMIPVPFVAWLTYAKAPRELQTLWLLLAIAATLWFAGSLVWYGLYFAGGGELPDTPAVSDAIFAAARIMLIAAIVVAMRAIVSFRLALLDAAVIASAGIAVGAVFVADGLRDAVDEASLLLLYSPLLGMLTLMLIASAVFGSPRPLPLSTVLVGAGQGLVTLGSMLYTHQAIEGGYVDVRWPDLFYTAGAGISYLGAAAILLRVDRPVRLLRVDIPGHPAGSIGVLLLSLAALTLALAVASYGLLGDRRALAVIGLLAAVAIGTAMAVRARDSIRTAEDAYARLDRALAEIEQTRDELTESNERLASANAQIQAMRIANAELFNLADERTHGRITELIESVGGELATLLADELERARRHG